MRLTGRKAALVNLDRLPRSLASKNSHASYWFTTESCTVNESVRKLRVAVGWDDDFGLMPIDGAKFVLEACEPRFESTLDVGHSGDIIDPDAEISLGLVG